jgi:hypothetical protein
MRRALLPNAILLLTVAVLACKPDPGPELTHGEYSRSTTHLTVSGTDTIVEGDDEMVSAYPSSVTIGDAHRYSADIGGNRMLGNYLVRHDTVLFYGKSEPFLVGLVAGDTLNLHVVAVSAANASQDVEIWFVRSN